MVKTASFCFLILFISFSAMSVEHWTREDLRSAIILLVEDPDLKPSSAFSELDRYIIFAKQQSWLDVETLAMSQKACIYDMLQETEKAKKIVDKYLPIAKRLKDTQSTLNLLSVQLQIYDLEVSQVNAAKIRLEYKAAALASGDKKSIATMYMELAQSIHVTGEIKKPLMYLQKALKVFEEINDLQGKIIVFNSLAILYDNLQDYEQAVGYYKKTVALHNEQKDSFSLSVSYFNIGQIYYKLNKIVEAEDMLNLALNMSRELKDEVGEAFALRYMGIIDFDKENYASAQRHFQKALDTFKRYDDNRMHFLTSLNFARTLGKLKETEKAIAALATLDTIVNDFNIPQYALDYYTLVYELEKQGQNFSASLTAIEIANKIKQNIHEKEDEESVQELILKFDISQKEAENKLLQKDNELKKLRIVESEVQRINLILMITFATFIGAVVTILLIKQILHRNHFKAMAMRDELTGAPNRRSITALASKRLKQCQEGNLPLAIAMLDIDKFKNFNDTYGHDVGDKVLRIFSDACRESLRSHDSFGRYGGEEWLLVLLDAQETQIDGIFKRLRARLSHVDIEGGPSDITLTFSLGATQRLSTDNSLESMIKRADDNLYKAKAAGRDQYVIGD
jgi:diguanylate cyclase (GGDEF)-like protein